VIHSPPADSAVQGRRLGLALAGAFLCAAGAVAAPPDLIVPYTPEPIVIDGDSDPAWAAAEDVFISTDAQSVVFRALHDDRTLYLYVDNLSDDTHLPGAGADIWFDDEGGTAPFLADGLMTASSCQATNRGEGNLGWFLTSTSPLALEERWTQWILGGSACPTFNGQNGSSAAIHFNSFPYSGLATEVALPIEGTSALAATSGQRLGLRVREFYAFPNLAQFAAGMWPPFFATWGDVALAALACNVHGETFDPHFPADWVAETTTGSGWVRSLDSGCPGPNVTGDSGEAACVVRGTSTLALDARLTSPWFSLRNQAAASLDYRAIYRDAPASPDRLDVEVRTATMDWTPVLSWTSGQGVVGDGAPVSVDLSSLAGEPRVQVRWRYVVPELQAGIGAQIDSVTLRCGPPLFSDAYESGLLTHWNAQQP